MTSTQNKLNTHNKWHELASFRGNIGVRTFAFAAAFLELCACSMDLYLLKYENDFSTYALALNNPGFIALYLLGYAMIITARLRNLQLPVSLAYFWVLALWICRFAVRSLTSLPFGMVYTAIVFILMPLFAKERKLLSLKSYK